MQKTKVKKGAGRPVKEWPKEKIALLKKLFPVKDNEYVAKQFGTTVSAVRNAAVRYRIKKADRYWDKSWEDYVVKNWEWQSPDELAIELKRKFSTEKTKWAVINKYRELTGKR